MSPRRYRLRPAAARELRAYTDYLRTEAGADIAARFVEMSQRSFAALAETPGMGAPVPSQNPQLAGLRKGRVEGFPKLLIFYIQERHGIRILRIIHASQDWWALFDLD